MHDAGGDSAGDLTGDDMGDDVGDDVTPDVRVDASDDGQHLHVGALAQRNVQEIDAVLDDASGDAVEGLVDELVGRYVARLNAGAFDEAGFVARVVLVERRDVYERDLEFDGRTWHVRSDPAPSARVTSRWQGLAPLVRCENGELPLTSALITGLCQVEGDPVDQERLTRCLALGSDDPLAVAYRLRGCSDRELSRALETLDVQAMVRAITDIGAEVTRQFGNGRASGRTVVTQFEVVTAKQTYVTQTVADGEQTIVHDAAVEPPTITIRFTNAVDFARLCMAETTALELVAAGKVEVEGDISVFAQVDMLRW